MFDFDIIMHVEEDYAVLTCFFLLSNIIIILVYMREN